VEALLLSSSTILLEAKASTGCLMKNASTHNFPIHYPTSMNKKIKDMAPQAPQNSHKMDFFWRYPQQPTIVNLPPFNGHM
jgi:hypothetical protein